LDAVIDVAIADSVERYATERDRARDTFVSILGHDLRNPLNAITMSASVLGRSDPLDDRTLRIAAQITRSAKRMETIISDVLDFARGRLGSGIPVTRESCDLRPIVESAVAELVAAHHDRAIRFHAHLAPGDLHGMWDAARMGQAVSNLVGNAIVHGHDPID